MRRPSPAKCDVTDRFTPSTRDVLQVRVLRTWVRTFRELMRLGRSRARAARPLWSRGAANTIATHDQPLRRRAVGLARARRPVLRAPAAVLDDRRAARRAEPLPDRGGAPADAAARP